MSPLPPIERHIEVTHLYQPDGWLDHVFLELDAGGKIVSAHRQRPPEWPGGASRLSGFVIPGIPNVHSHAFQRALVGRSEAACPERNDSFWTWRLRMYELALRLAPSQVEAIAAQLYVELLESGFTSVGEFHYLHHDPRGQPYAQRAELGERIQAAAHATGVALTHLPVLYLQGGFDTEPHVEQRRFVHDSVDDFMQTWSAFRATGRTVVGAAPHSLRAVPPRALEQLSELASGPLHIHIAEQEREVAEALARLGARPLRWLFDQLEVNERWCLIHATWCDSDELLALAQSGATAGLCPTTEANLGDGVFPTRDFLAAGGALAVGTDSHVGSDPAEELRWLELQQRLSQRARNVLATPGEPHPARALLNHAVTHGSRALGQPAGQLTPGNLADFLVLDSEHPRLWGHSTETVLDAWVFGASARCVSEVFVGGRRVVSQGRHFARERIFTSYTRALRELWP